MQTVFRRFIASIRVLLHSTPRGAVLVEFGLVVPFLILLIVALIDFGLGFHGALQVQDAAAAGAEYATMHAWNPASVTGAVQTATSLGNSITMASDPTFGGATPQKVCACAGSGRLTATSAGFYNPNFDACCTSAATGISGSCGNPMCAAGEAPGVYASVAGQLNYSPILPYPGISGGVTLKGVSYRRIK